MKTGDTLFGCPIVVTDSGPSDRVLLWNGKWTQEMLDNLPDSAKLYIAFSAGVPCEVGTEYDRSKSVLTMHLRSTAKFTLIADPNGKIVVKYLPNDHE